MVLGSTGGEVITVYGPTPAAIVACTNFDDDGLCDIDVDDDDDGDGALDGDDNADNDPNHCHDDDGDTCDECFDGSLDTTNNADGHDYDGDGACDGVCDNAADCLGYLGDADYYPNSVADADDDNDGALDGVDSDDNDAFVCNDDDNDSCDECSSGYYDQGLDDGTSSGADVDGDGHPDDGDGWDYDGDGICDAGDNDSDNDGANDDVDSAPNDEFVCSDDDDDLCDDCSDGSYGLESDGDDFDADGICDAGDPAAPLVVKTFGGPNEVHIGHSHSMHAPQGLTYNVYRDGELVGQSGYGQYTNPYFEANGGDHGLAYGYIDPDGGWGLEYATEYCYTVTSVNPYGRESNDANSLSVDPDTGAPVLVTVDASCSSTLPPSPIGVAVTADPQGLLTSGQLPNAVHVSIIPLWWVSGFQFDIAFDTAELAIAGLVGGYAGYEMHQELFYSNGTTMGFSLSGDLIPPAQLTYALAGNDPANFMAALMAGDIAPIPIATYVFVPTTSEFSSDVKVSLSNWTFGGDEGETVFASDMSTDCPQDPSGASCPFNHFYGAELEDTFEYSVDCSNEQYSCNDIPGTGIVCDGSISGLTDGSPGWDYTDQCGECDDDGLTDCYDLNISLYEGANLISFPALPEVIDGTEHSVANIFAGANSVIGQGIGAINMDGSWIGSLTTVSQDDGYWVQVSEDINLITADADPVSYDADGEVVYDIRYGNNLISYPFINSQFIADALGDAAANVYALAGEGVAALYSNDANGGAGAWVGSLNAFEGGRGYWVIANNDFTFSFNSNGGSLAKQKPIRVVPEVYSYRQSDQQAFFFVNNATIQGKALESEDVVIAYNGDVVVGSRYWDGEFTDIPAMDAKDGDMISFKVLDASSGELIEMETDGNVQWINNGIEVVNLIDVFVPTEVSLSNAYPNPFNPVTMLSYDVPSDMNVSLAIYDVRGRLVEELVNDMHEQGRYEITWNADLRSSGVYMIKMTAGTAVKVQKVMLVK
jgi:hypothetical protein